MPDAFAIESKAPSSVKWCGRLAALISACDGVATGREHLERAQQQGLIGGDVTQAEFADVLGTLIGQGILRLRERPLPARETAAEGPA